MTLTPAVVSVGPTFTVTCCLNYHGTTEIDGFAFVINHNPAGLSAVSNSFLLTSTASDANGSVANVEFFREGTIKLGEGATSPYSFTWSNAPPGNYVLTARATDNLGQGPRRG